MLGRRELMAIKTNEIDDRSVISRIDNSSRLVFGSLYEIRQEQSDLRALNMARKRSRKSISTTNQSLDLDSFTSTTSTHTSICISLQRFINRSSPPFSTQTLHYTTRPSPVLHPFTQNPHNQNNCAR